MLAQQVVVDCTVYCSPYRFLPFCQVKCVFLMSFTGWMGAALCLCDVIVCGPSLFHIRSSILSMPFTDMTCISKAFSLHHKTLPVTWLLKSEKTTAVFLTPSFHRRQEVMPAWNMISILLVLRCYFNNVTLPKMCFVFSSHKEFSVRFESLTKHCKSVV